MDINKVLVEYDSMFGKCSMESIGDFLRDKLEEARSENDDSSVASLLNEIIGFCRDTSRQADGLKYCKELIIHMDKMNLVGTASYGKSLLNIANCYRAFGHLDESLRMYERILHIYESKLNENDFDYASLYNNWGLLYQEMGNYAEAVSVLSKALAVVDRYDKAVMEQATTRTNLAASLIKLAETDDAADSVEKIYSTAMKFLTQAIDIYERDGGRDFHYSGALAAMGDALYFKKQYDKSALYYEKAMKEIEKHVGKTDAYVRICEKYESAHTKALDSIAKGEYEIKLPVQPGNKAVSSEVQNVQPEIEEEVAQTMIEKSRAFYNQYGKQMIHDAFSEYEDRIAVGIVGEGSDCFGYDDEISQDHDYGVGFCMWVRDEVYAEIGENLQAEYDRLVKKYLGDTGAYASRRGVFSIDAFYESILGIKRLSGRLKPHEYEDETGVHVSAPAFEEKLWRLFDENSLAAATNGEVFRDDEGLFTMIRKELMAYFPENVWRSHLAQQLHTFSQSVQYNYARMMSRKDKLAARLCVARGMESAIHIAFLLEKKYAPYYKWLGHAARSLERMYGIVPIVYDIADMEIDENAWKDVEYSAYHINRRDKIVAGFESIAVLILDELRRRGLIVGNDPFLDSYCRDIQNKKIIQKNNAGVDETGGSSKMNRKEMIEAIIKEEWNQFDKVKNEGGRASCQDDWNTFYVMRKSQYLAWNDELLASYLGDLMDAGAKGWNLIMEKYARMEESTAPEKYAELAKDLPVRSEERIKIQEEIIKIQVAWMEEFATKYPKMAGNARSIHTSEDNMYNTSYETYLRGELGTYSEETFVLYGRFIVDLNRRGENLAKTIMTNTALLYGYENLDMAEERL